MIMKGIVSAVYPDENRVAVILPEKDNVVTFPLEIYGGTKTAGEYEINEFVLVVAFNGDFSDAIMLGKN